MSFDPTPDDTQLPKDSRHDPILDAEKIDLNIPRQEYTRLESNLPYQPKGFNDIYEEAKWLRKLSGKTAIAFMMTFLVLFLAGKYAEAVDAKRVDPNLWGKSLDSLVMGEKTIVVEQDNTPPTFFERFGLQLLAAMGSVGFFIFASSAVSEISFRAYEKREMESYEVLDTLTKSHGQKLLQLGSYFLMGLMLVSVVSIGIAMSEHESIATAVLMVLFFAEYYLLLRTMFSVQAMIGEDLSPRDALARSWDLTHGNVLRLIWWGFIFYVIFSLTLFFLYLIPAILFTVLLMAVFSLISIEIGLTIASLLLLPFIAKQMSLMFYFQMALYRELRLRHDGIDPQHPEDNTMPVMA